MAHSIDWSYWSKNILYSIRNCFYHFRTFCDKIKVQIQNNEVIEQAVAANISYIKSETLTSELFFNENLENGTEIEFDDLKTLISISK